MFGSSELGVHLNSGGMGWWGSVDVVGFTFNENVRNGRGSKAKIGREIVFGVVMGDLVLSVCVLLGNGGVVVVAGRGGVVVVAGRGGVVVVFGRWGCLLVDGGMRITVGECALTMGQLLLGDYLWFLIQVCHVFNILLDTFDIWI